MKMKIFIIVCLSSLLILAGSAAMVFIQIQRMQGITLDTLTEKLYTENTDILSWIMTSFDPGHIGDLTLPSSWAEIIVVDADDLRITSSTHSDHVGKSMYELPEVLDQAEEILNAVKKGQPARISAERYMVAVSAAHQNRHIIALKPKAWEENLVSMQDSQIREKTEGLKRLLVIYAIAGLCIVLVVAAFVSILVTRPYARVFTAIEELSLGNFEIEAPEMSTREMKNLSASFLRLKASLEMALERLGGA
ncbi:MAG: hypothetical protein ACP5G0_12200 [Desulfomonilia bacterium]